MGFIFRTGQTPDLQEDLNLRPPACEAESAVHGGARRGTKRHSSRVWGGSDAPPVPGVPRGDLPQICHNCRGQNSTPSALRQLARHRTQQRPQCLSLNSAPAVVHVRQRRRRERELGQRRRTLVYEPPKPAPRRASRNVAAVDSSGGLAQGMSVVGFEVAGAGEPTLFLAVTATRIVLPASAAVTV